MNKKTLLVPVTSAVLSLLLMLLQYVIITRVDTIARDVKGIDRRLSRMEGRLMMPADDGAILAERGGR